MIEMATYDIKELASSYCENPDMNKLEIYSNLAIIQIRRWLIDPEFENNEDNLGHLSIAAAGLAYYYYVLDRVQKQPSGEFSANGVSAKSNFDEQLKKAKTLVNEHLKVVSHLMHIPISGFAFLNVEE